MDMPTSTEELASLPQGEQRFVSLIIGGNFAAYGVGFAAEQATLAQLRHHHRELNRFSNIALLRVGSGGRFEGAGLGDTEFVLLTVDAIEDGEQSFETVDAADQSKLKFNYPAQFFEQLIEIASADIMSVGLTTYMRVTLEHKRVDGGGKLSYHPDSEVPYPGRILEGELVAGSPLVFEIAKRKVFGEIAGDSKILRGLRKELRVIKKVLETGFSRTVHQFDPSIGEIFFNPSEKQFGLKYGVLRYVQTALSIEFFELFQRHGMQIDDYMDLPPSVEERIRYAFRKGWVANEEDLIAAGLIYIQGLEIQTTMKANHYSESGKRIFAVQGGLSAIHQDVIDIFKNRLLV